MEGYIQEYEVKATQTDDITNRFSYHTPKGSQSVRYENIRDEAKRFAMELLALCPPSRELSLALTKLEEVVFWSNAAISRNE